MQGQLVKAKKVLLQVSNTRQEAELTKIALMKLLKKNRPNRIKMKRLFRLKG